MSQDKEVGTLSRKVSMLETGEEPKHHITVHVYKSRFLLHDFIFQLVFMKIRQQWHSVFCY